MSEYRWYFEASVALAILVFPIALHALCYGCEPPLPRAGARKVPTAPRVGSTFCCPHIMIKGSAREPVRINICPFIFMFSYTFAIIGLAIYVLLCWAERQRGIA